MIRVIEGDCREALKTLPDDSVHCVVTSPPYWGLRDYGADEQIGLEPTPQDFVRSLVLVFSEVRRVLRPDGTVWLNLGDSYARAQETNVPQTRNKAHGYPVHAKAGSSDGKVGRADRPGSRVAAMGLKPKDLVGIPWRVALALQEAGWWLRMDIIWAKPNPMPESVEDRPTRAHEYIFLLSKAERYYYDYEAIREPVQESTVARMSQNDGNPVWNGNRDRGFPGNQQTMDVAKFMDPSGMRNKRSVWNVTTKPLGDAHFATFPPECPAGGTVLDPFGGAGTTGLVADRHGRNAILIEINPKYAEMARKRIYNDAPLFADVS